MNNVKEQKPMSVDRPQPPEIEGLRLTALQTWSEAVPTSRRGLMIFAGAVLLTVFGIGGTWGATAKLGGALVSSGRVFAEGYNRAVQHLEGGIIDDILVKEGDHVEAGQVLIHLDETAARSQLDRYQIDKAVATIELTRWRTERDESQNTFTVDPEALKPVADHPRVVEALSDQIAEFKSSRTAREQQLLVLDGKIANEKEDIGYLQNLLKAYGDQTELLRKEEQSYLDLLKKGLIRQSQVFALQRQLAQIEGQRANALAAIQKSHHNIQSYQDEKQRILSEHAELVSQKITQTQQNLNQSDDFLTRLQDVLRRSAITAPVSGTVLTLEFKSIGAVVKPGGEVAEILPSEAALMMEAFVSPKDIDKVFVNQAVEIIFASDQTKVIPPLEGTVSYISADTFIQEKTGAPYYIAHVVLNPEHHGRNILPGNVADVYFQTEAKTLFEYIAEPVSRFALRTYTE